MGGFDFNFAAERLSQREPPDAFVVAMGSSW